MANETKNTTNLTNESVHASAFTDETKANFAGAGFDIATFDQSTFDQIYDTAITPYTNETKH